MQRPRSSHQRGSQYVSFFGVWDLSPQMDRLGDQHSCRLLGLVRGVYEVSLQADLRR